MRMVEGRVGCVRSVEWRRFVVCLVVQWTMRGCKCFYMGGCESVSGCVCMWVCEIMVMYYVRKSEDR